MIAPFLLLTILLALGCGQSGGAPTRAAPIPTPTPAPTGPSWTSGVYASASQFKDRCQTVRTGVDFEGNPFIDRPGSTVEENFWLRSWTQETYLWNTEVIDRDPRSFNNPIAYFDVLRTTATTPSGKDKDDFHFSQPTDEFLRERNSAPTSGYGARLIALSTTVPRDFRVAFTEANSPASTVIAGQANFMRGTKILEVDGVDLVNANTNAQIDILNDGLFPASAGEQHNFLVQDAGSALTRTVMMISADITPKPVNRTSVIATPTGDVGYILFNTFSPFASEKAIADAITAMKTSGVTDLVLDLRYNGGGLLAVAAQLGYMVAGDVRTSGKIYEQLQFNAAAGNRNPVTGAVNDPFPFIDTGLGFSLPDGAPLSSLNLSRVFILTTGGTCSASESVMNALRGIDVEVILIGNRTCGKPFGFYPQDNCGETYYTIQFRGVNDKGFGDYADGFIAGNSNAAFGVRAPGCAVSDDFDHALGDQNEALLAAALQYRQTGACPTPPPASPKISTASVAKAGAPALAIGKPVGDIYETNRDMTMPN